LREVPPLRRELIVAVDPQLAFDVFTRDIGRWWPLEDHGVYGAGATVAFEGPDLVERSPAGQSAVWGTVSAWEPGRRVAFTWHPGRPANPATQVEVRFEEIADGTRVTLTHSGWDAYDEPWRVREGYDSGWPHVLELFESETVHGVSSPSGADAPPLDPRYAGPLQAVLAHGRGFGHAEHLELAWRYLDRFEPDDAERAMAEAIRHVAATHGQPDRYHETMTVAWVKLVAAHREECEAETFDEFIADNERLLDRDLLKRHYSPERIASAGARAEFTAPDLRDLPSGT
jgi:Activator of Hsp90 ATPase homolog 1-like protein